MSGGWWRWIAGGLTLLVALGGCRGPGPGTVPPSNDHWLVVWAEDVDRTHPDFLAVLDEDGNVVRTIPVKSSGNGPQGMNTELRRDRRVFATGGLTNRHVRLRSARSTAGHAGARRRPGRRPHAGGTARRRDGAGRACRRRLRRPDGLPGRPARGAALRRRSACARPRRPVRRRRGGARSGGARLHRGASGHRGGARAATARHRQPGPWRHAHVARRADLGNHGPALVALRAGVREEPRAPSRRPWRREPRTANPGLPPSQAGAGRERQRGRRGISLRHDGPSRSRLPAGRRSRRGLATGRRRRHPRRSHLRHRARRLAAGRLPVAR